METSDYQIFTFIFHFYLFMFYFHVSTFTCLLSVLTFTFYVHVLFLTREAEALERQLEEDTAHLETLQIEMRIKMNEKKEAEMKMKREKNRLNKMDTKKTFGEQEIDREDQSGFWTYPEVD